MGTKLYIKTYGCQMNEYDTQKTVEILKKEKNIELTQSPDCLLYTSPSPRDGLLSRMPSSA